MMSHEEIVAKLKALEADETMMTRDSYTPNAADWPTGRIPFVDLHLAYLRTHKTVNPSDYISNLQLMIKKR